MPHVHPKTTRCGIVRSCNETTVTFEGNWDPHYFVVVRTVYPNKVYFGTNRRTIAVGPHGTTSLQTFLRYRLLPSIQTPYHPEYQTTKETYCPSIKRLGWSRESQKYDSTRGSGQWYGKGEEPDRTHRESRVKSMSEEVLRTGLRKFGHIGDWDFKLTK